MKKPNKYSPEVRERAVRMVQEHPSQWAAIESIAPKIGCVPQTLHDWVKKYEIDTGMRDAYRVEPICKVLQIAPSGYRRHAAEQRNPALRCAHAQRDDELMPQIQRV